MKRRTFVGVTAAIGAGLLGTAGCGSQPEASRPSADLPSPVDGAYAVKIEANSPAGLPKCTSALAGTVAYVSAPAGLYACSGGSWCAITCNAASAGDVAYASSTQTLVACVSSSWTQIALPQGPQGPKGAAGAAGVTGATGPAGATGTTGPQGATGASGATGPQGPTGAQGAAGTNGTNGTNGANGTSGTNGLDSLISVTPLPADSSACPAGGEDIQTGLDQDGDGILEPNEVQNDTPLCSPVTQGSNDGAAESSDAGDASVDVATPVPLPPPATTPLVVYDDALESPFQNDSWGAGINFSNVSPAPMSGAYDMAVPLIQYSSGIFFDDGAAIDLRSYAALDLWVARAPDNQFENATLSFVLQGANQTVGAVFVDLPLLPGWNHLQLPLSQFGTLSQPVDGFLALLETQPSITLYFDNISFLPASDAGP
jgi:Collagen triple helix repeat (20 copies)